MASTDLGRRFMASTRGRVVALLRREVRTVDELAEALGMTSNAVRSHLTTLERDGLVRQAGVRRGQGAGKPAVFYELAPTTELLFSNAYPPVLNALLEVVISEVPERAEALMRQVGLRLAASLGGRATGSFPDRVRAAADVLAALGGDVEVVDDNGSLTIRGCGCPLSTAVAQRPEVCRAVEALVAEISGGEATSACERGDRPRCRFRLTAEV